MKDSYIQKLESVIKQMLQPLRDIPFNLVIESISGYKVIPFDPADTDDLALLEDLKKAAKLTGQKLNKKPIIRGHPNEVGNDIEEYVKEALKKLGYEPGTPACQSGKKKSTGYPDIFFKDNKGRANYLECKTYNIENVGTAQRSFYFSPSEDFKITQDAHHFVLSFEVFVDARRRGKNVYKCRHWKIIDVERLPVDVKYEFNSDNARLYETGATLAEGSI